VKRTCSLSLRVERTWLAVTPLWSKKTMGSSMLPATEILIYFTDLALLMVSGY
jgi:hypothetical protein